MKNYEALMREALVGDLSPEDRARLDAYLAENLTEAQTFREMQGVLSLTSTVEPATQSEEYWDGYYDRLVDRMAREARKAQTSWWEASWAKLQTWLMPLPTWSYQLAVAVVLIAAGIAIGRYSTAPSDVESAVVTQGVTSDAVAMPVALQERTTRYLERSTVLLLGLVHFDTEAAEPATLNLDRKQAIASDLIQEASLLREDLEPTQQEQLRKLISDLEVILLQIANLEAEHDVPAIELVKRGVDERGILLKINLTKMRMEEVQPNKDAAASDAEHFSI